MPIKPRRPEAYTGSNPYIFMSYRRKDSASMEEIVRCLKRNAYNVWYDEGLIPANEWDDEIACRVESCGFFVALISKNYMDSRNCREELRFAWETERPCLLIYLEPDAKLSPGMRMHFSGQQFLRCWEYDSVEDMLQLAARNPGFELCRDSKGASKEIAIPMQADSAASKTVTVKPSLSKPCPVPTSNAAKDSVPSPVEDFVFEISRGVVAITKYVGKGGTVAIPSIIGVTPVTSIRYGAFQGCTNLTSVTILDGVTRIGYGAFYGCIGLTSVTIPNSIESIGKGAFQGCTGLTSVTIPDGVTNIGDSAFRGCTGMISVTIPDGVTSIGEAAFLGCEQLKDVYYIGSHPEWEAITIGGFNHCLTDTTIHYNTPKPTASP